MVRCSVVARRVAGSATHGSGLARIRISGMIVHAPGLARRACACPAIGGRPGSAIAGSGMAVRGSTRTSIRGGTRVVVRCRTGMIIRHRARVTICGRALAAIHRPIRSVALSIRATACARMLLRRG